MILLNYLEKYIEQNKSQLPVGLVSVRKQLESIGSQKVDSNPKKQCEIRRQLQVIAEMLEQNWVDNDLEARTKQLENVLESFTYLKDKYLELLCTTNQQKIVFWIEEKLIAQILFDKGVVFLFSERGLGVHDRYRRLIEGIKNTSKVADKYWFFLDLEQRKIVETIHTEIWTLSSNNRSGTGETLELIPERRQAIREIAGFTLWRIQELKEKQIVQEQEEKRKEALERLREKVESNQISTPEGEQHLESFKKSIDNFRAAGHKVYAEDNY
ncbi:MAG: hypothetical protein SW833_00340 [Cyanobacteriota bacterium]|nr:hypothetical protein [Cyanobacteriota bacterium]